MDCLVKKLNTNIIIQARVLSKRLPGKLFFNFFNSEIIHRIIKISKSIYGINKIILATSKNNENSVLKKICNDNKIIFFNDHKDEENVFERYQYAIRKYPCDYFIRMTADNYLMQPILFKKLLTLTFKGNYDYSFIKPLSHFCGEIVRSEVFINRKLKTKLEREHVTWGLRNDKLIKKLELPSNFNGINHNSPIVLDTIEDLYLLKNIEQKFPKLRNVNCIKELISIQRNDATGR